MAFLDKYPYTNYHELNLDWLIETVNEVNETVDYIKEQFSKIEILTKDEINQLIATAINTYDDTIKHVIESSKQSAIDASKTYTDAQNLIIRDLITSSCAELLETSKNYSIDLYNQMKDYVDGKLIDYNFMYSPISGKYEDVRNVLIDVITTFHKNNSLTASEYDALQLTASAYDAHNLTAVDYDFNSKTILV